MTIKGCWNCGGDDLGLGCGLVRDPQAKWWQIWRSVTCPACLGSGRREPEEAFQETMLGSMHKDRTVVHKSNHLLTLHDEESPVTIQVMKSERPGMFIAVFEDPYEYARAETISETEAINLCRQFDRNFPMADLPKRVRLI